tara:strand:+ start:1535 stop:1756 length:222 start_codon:yes stop_codon:yes gene_type:complete
VGHYDEEREADRIKSSPKIMTYVDYKFETTPQGLTFTDDEWPINLKYLDIGDKFVLTLDDKGRTMFKKLIYPV